MEEESYCESYLRSESEIKDDEYIRETISKILNADPDANGKNCIWIIDAFINKEFRLDEDEERVKEDILKFKNLFGERRPLPKKGYYELKIMNRERMEKETKKSIAKTKTKSSKVEFNDCLSFFKNVKNTLPEPYRSYDKEQSNQLFEKIKQANPTDNLNICLWIVEEIKRGFIKEEELNEVRENLEKYFTEHKDVPLPNFYPNFPIFSNYQIVKDTISKKDIDKKIDLISVSDLGILLSPKTRETSCYYGSQTSWCTARKDKHNMFEYYNKKGDIFIWFDKKINDKFQFHFKEIQFMDKDDNPISKKRFKEFLNHPILGVLFKDELERGKMEWKMSKLIQFSKDFYPDWDYIQSNEFLEGILSNPKKILKYSQEMLGGKRWDEGEKRLLQMANNAFQEKDWYMLDNTLQYIFNYAYEMKEPWKEAEPYLLLNIGLATQYAINNLKERWLEMEKQINDPRDLLNYAQFVLKRRWKDVEDLDPKRTKEIEDKIANEIYLAFNYANDVIKGRWKEAEPMMLNDIRTDRNPNHLYYPVNYATNQIKGRWIEAEPYILKSPEYAYLYAKDVIRGRWRQAEPIILQYKSLLPLGNKYILDYAKDVIKGRWKKAEPYLFEKDQNKILKDYLNYFQLNESDLNKSISPTPKEWISEINKLIRNNVETNTKSEKKKSILELFDYLLDYPDYLKLDKYKKILEMTIQKSEEYKDLDPLFQEYYQNFINLK
jgi:hypothetical protein